MKNIFKLIAKSPFNPMQDHAEKVNNCVLDLKDFFKILQNDFNKAKEIKNKISSSEHEADKIKDGIRNSLGESLFLPVKRVDLLEILGIQDAIADTAEDIAVLATTKDNFTFPNELFILIDIVLDRSIATFKKYKRIVDNLDELLEATFSGPLAEKTRKDIDEVCFLEHETDIAQKVFLKKFFEYDEKLSLSDFWLIAKLSKSVGDIANISEKAANKIRLILLG